MESNEKNKEDRDALIATLKANEGLDIEGEGDVLDLKQERENCVSRRR